MHHDLIKTAAVVLLCAAPAAHAQPAAPSPAAASAAPAWKQIFENGQLTYYIDAAGLQRSGESSVASLLQYKVPQVINGGQVWSIVSHMKLNCGRDQMVTVDNTLYALKMGAGPVVEAQPSNDTWHAPQPGSLGGLIWSKTCGA